MGVYFDGFGQYTIQTIYQMPKCFYENSSLNGKLIIKVGQNTSSTNGSNANAYKITFLNN